MGTYKPCSTFSWLLKPVRDEYGGGEGGENLPGVPEQSTEEWGGGEEYYDEGNGAEPGQKCYLGC